MIDCCSNTIYYFGIEFKTCFADILMLIFQNKIKIDKLKVNLYYDFRFLRF